MQSYQKQLTILERELTKLDKVKEAILVRAEKEKIAGLLQDASISVGISNSEEPAASGRLNGYGIGSLSKPLGKSPPSSKDFIRIKTWDVDNAPDGWVALRSNGIVVSHLDKRLSSPNDRIVDFDCSKAGGIVMLKANGTIDGSHCEFQPDGGIKDQLVEIVDVAISSKSRLIDDEVAVAVKKDGTLVCWGPGTKKPGFTGPPEDATKNVISIEQAPYAFAAIKKDGSLALWNFGSGGGSIEIPDQHKRERFQKVAMAESHIVGLLKNGSLVAWGSNSKGQSNIPSDMGRCSDVATIFNVISLGKRENGEWLAWGSDYGGIRDRLNEVKRFSGVAGKLFPPFKYAYAVWID